MQAVADGKTYGYAKTIIIKLYIAAALFWAYNVISLKLRGFGPVQPKKGAGQFGEFRVVFVLT